MSFSRRNKGHIAPGHIGYANVRSGYVIGDSPMHKLKPAQKAKLLKAVLSSDSNGHSKSIQSANN